MFAEILSRLCSVFFNRFRKHPLALRPEDLRSLQISFSQFGEDLIVHDHLKREPAEQRGLYVDVGCYDPFVFSNTRLLNLHGWRGVNIDASEAVIGKFRRWRPHDVNICAAISSGPKEMKFRSRAGASAKLVDPAAVTDGRARPGEITVQTVALEEVLERDELRGRGIDLLDIDCEGHDFAVLSGHNFSSVRPKMIIIEAHTAPEEEVIGRHLAARDYTPVRRCGPSLVFRDRLWFDARGSGA